MNAPVPSPPPAPKPDDDEEESWFSPKSWKRWIQKSISGFFSSIFDFGNIFTLALLAMGAYILARTEWGKEVIKGIAGLFPEDWHVPVVLGEMLKSMGIDIPGLGLDTIQTANQFRDLAKDKISPNLLNVIAPAGDDVTFLRNKATLTATGANLTSGVNDTLIFGLMFKTNAATAGGATTYSPNAEGRALLQQLIAATPAPPANGAAMDASTQSILNAVRKMTADPAKVNLLLADTEMRRMMMSAITRFNLIPMLSTINPNALDQFITTVGMTAAGQPTPAFSNFIGQALNPSNPSGVGGALVTLLLSPEASSNPRSAAPAWKALATAIPDSSIPAEQRPVLQLMRTHAEPTLILMKTLGPEKTQQLMTLITAPAGETPAQAEDRKKKITAFALLEPAFKTFADTPNLMNSLPAGDLRNGLETLHRMSTLTIESARKITINGVSPDAVVDSFTVRGNDGNPLRNPQTNTEMLTLKPFLTREGRAMLRQAGLENIARLAQENHVPLLTKNNLNLFMAFGDAIGQNPANTSNQERTKNVVYAVQEMMLNNTIEPFKKLSAAEIAGFFSNAANRAAFDQLLKNLETTANTPGTEQIKTLQRAWSSDWNGKHESLGDVLADEKGAQFLLDKLKNDSTAQTNGWLSGALGLLNDVTAPAVVRANQDVLKLLLPSPQTQQPAAAR
jgi:hypothetical protein